MKMFSIFVLFVLILVHVRNVFCIGLTTIQDNALCGLIAATTVSNYYTDWSCDTNGIVSTDPCTTLWKNVVCASSAVVSITVNDKRITGILL